MHDPPGGENGMETHGHVEQALFFLSGTGKAILDGVESRVQAGDAVMVTPGSRHSVVNNGRDPLEISTIYAPPNRIDGRIHATQASARTTYREIADQRTHAVRRSARVSAVHRSGLRRARSPIGS